MVIKKENVITKQKALARRPRLWRGGRKRNVSLPALLAMAETLGTIFLPEKPVEFLS
jgi:hypothetical protein